ncbi:hypothetical protein H3L92_10970 [Neisseria dentiae]|nr:hypothetical protein H3L92_10970 [Neisseria dentiae]
MIFRKERGNALPANNQNDLFDNYVVLDTETTGLDDDAEIIEIAIIDIDDNVLLNTLIRPSKPMPDWCEAVRIHGITNEMLDGAPTWKEMYPRIVEILSGKQVVIYNADFDLRLIRQTCDKYDLQAPIDTAFCAMNHYSEWYGEKSYTFPGRYHKQSLYKAVRFTGNKFSGENHRALTDCKATLSVLKSINGVNSPELMREEVINEFKRKTSLLFDDAVVVGFNVSGNIKSQNILEIGIIDTQGNILLDTFVCPKRKISDNTKYLKFIGKSAAEFSNFPKWDELYELVFSLLDSKKVFCINNNTIKNINLENKKYGLPEIDFIELSVNEVFYNLNSLGVENGLYNLSCTADKLNMKIDKLRSVSSCLVFCEMMKHLDIEK